MKKIIFFLALCFGVIVNGAKAQDIPTLLKEGLQLERSQKEVEALEKYKRILSQDPNNVTALVRAAELSTMLAGFNEKDTKSKQLFLSSAGAYAVRAYAANPKNAEAAYVMALTQAKLSDIQPDNKKLIECVRNSKIYADEALAINPGHAKANFTLGKWHMEMANLNLVKKAAVKLMYGGLPEGSMDSAVVYLEKARTQDPYFVNTYLELAKIYNQLHQPTKVIEVLTKMVKLPTRKTEDISLKAAGAQMLAAAQ
ncbi:MAG: tetratricopeptide repeat protein [Sediminibacterium sp.]